MRHIYAYTHCDEHGAAQNVDIVPLCTQTCRQTDKLQSTRNMISSRGVRSCPMLIIMRVLFDKPGHRVRACLCPVGSTRSHRSCAAEPTGFSSEIGTKLRDLAVGQAGAAATLGQHCPQMTQRHCINTLGVVYKRHKQ